MAAPKLFVSYSWTSPDHEAWVLQLSTDLRESGVDVILDKWDLKEGHDAHAFMEKMVTDPEIRKVILVCDKGYVDKTDGRRGVSERKPRLSLVRYMRSRHRISSSQ
ncbi:MAG: SEFIR domain-containing protein [Candidatus Zixiibacteriota bacterium]